MVRSKYKKACPQWYVRTDFFRSYGKFNPTFIYRLGASKSMTVPTDCAARTPHTSVNHATLLSPPVRRGKGPADGG